MEAHVTIKITDGKKVGVTTSLEHDDLVMFYLIEAIYAIRNKQYERFTKKTKAD